MKLKCLVNNISDILEESIQNFKKIFKWYVKKVNNMKAVAKFW